MAPAPMATGAAHTSARRTRARVLAAGAAASPASHSAPATGTRLGRTTSASAARLPESRGAPARGEPMSSNAPSQSAAAGRSLMVCIAAKSTGGLVATSTVAAAATRGGAVVAREQERAPGEQAGAKRRPHVAPGLARHRGAGGHQPRQPRGIGGAEFALDMRGRVAEGRHEPSALGPGAGAQDRGRHAPAAGRPQARLADIAAGIGGRPPRVLRTRPRSARAPAPRVPRPTAPRGRPARAGR